MMAKSQRSKQNTTTIRVNARDRDYLRTLGSGSPGLGVVRMLAIVHALRRHELPQFTAEEREILDEKLGRLETWGSRMPLASVPAVLGAMVKTVMQATPEEREFRKKLADKVMQLKAGEIAALLLRQGMEE
jgi:hypothetical protein